MDPKIKIVGLGGAGEKIVQAISEKVNLDGMKGIECCCFGAETDEDAFLDDGDCDMLLSERAEETELKMEGTVDFYNVFRCEEVLKQPQFADKSKSTVDQAFKAVNRSMVERIFAFVKMFKGKSKIMVDYGDFIALLKSEKSGKRMTYLEASASGERWLDSCVEQLADGCKKLKCCSDNIVFQIEHDLSLTFLEYDDALNKLCKLNDYGEDSQIIISDVTNESAEKGGVSECGLFSKAENFSSKLPPGNFLTVFSCIFGKKVF